jgi:hypothetical protein
MLAEAAAAAQEVASAADDGAIDEVTRTLAEQEAERILAKAREEAESLLQRAEREAQQAVDLQRDLEAKVALLDDESASTSQRAANIEAAARERAQGVMDRAEESARAIKKAAARTRDQADEDRLEAAKKVSAAQRDARELTGRADPPSRGRGRSSARG